jgi:RNA polymerase primary sigma factor
MSYEDFLDSRNLRLYLSQIAKLPLYTEDEEKELGWKAQRGDGEALRKLVEANLRFVVSYVRKYRGMGLSMLDLIDEGNLGLIEAAKRFDPDRNVRFVSYAVWWIRQAVVHALTQSARVFSLPQKLSDQISQMKKKVAEMKADKGREPSREEIAAGLGISEEDVEDLLILSERPPFERPGWPTAISTSGQDRRPGNAFRSNTRSSSSIQQQVRDILGELDEKEATVLN